MTGDLFRGHHPHDAHVRARVLLQLPLLAPFCVHSCGDDADEIDDCLAVFARDAAEALDLATPYLIEPRAGRVLAAPELETLRAYLRPSRGAFLERPVLRWEDPHRGQRLAWRRAGYGEESETTCIECHLPANRLTDLEPCSICRLCPECGCAEDCQTRDRPTTYTTDLGGSWDVWIGPGYRVLKGGKLKATGEEPGTGRAFDGKSWVRTGRVFSGSRWRNPYLPRPARLEQLPHAELALVAELWGRTHSPLRARIQRELRGLRLGTDSEAHGLILARAADDAPRGQVLAELAELRAPTLDLFPSGASS